MNNLTVARILREIANILQAQGVQYKPRAYRNAAAAIETYPRDINELDDLTKIPSVGEHIAKKIEELLKTGDLEYLKRLRKEIGFDIEQFISIPGMGVKSAGLIYESLKIKTLPQLLKAAKSKKIRGIKGLGPKTEEIVIQNVELGLNKERRIPFGLMQPIAENLKEQIEPHAEFVEIVGSYRRRKETIGDIDILAVGKNIIELFVKLPKVTKIISKGKTRCAAIIDDSIHVDLRVVKMEQAGAALQYFTGSREHGIHLRKIAIKKGLKLNEYGLYERKSGRLIAQKEEKEIYEKIGLEFIPPEIRRDMGEIEAAQNNKLPKLAAKLYGDFHTHTTNSDGADTIKSMLVKAQELGHKFIGISDHIGGPAIASKLKRTAGYIKKIRNASKNADIEVYCGAEVDIKKDGSLSLPQTELKNLDYVIGGIHSNFSMSRSEMTKRILTAFDNRHLTILAHPTGRILQSRKGYDFDTQKVFSMAVQTHKYLEINCNPKRYDLSTELIKNAWEYGCMFAIGSDAHSVQGLNYIHYGLSLARRGWLSSKNILNCKKAPLTKCY